MGGLIAFLLLLILLTLGFGFWPAIGVAIGGPLAIFLMLCAVGLVIACLKGILICLNNILIGIGMFIGFVLSLIIHPRQPLRSLSPSTLDVFKARSVAILVFTPLLMCAAVWDYAQAEPNITILKVKSYQDRVLPPSEFEQSLKPILPPEEYDYPYKGKLIIGTVATLEDLQKECNLNFSGLLGCSFRRNDNTCRIILVDEKFMHMRGWTRQQMLRHEIGHCNGWPQVHPGMRPYDAKPGTAPVLDVDGIIYPVWKVWPR